MRFTIFSSDFKNRPGSVETKNRVAAVFLILIVATFAVYILRLFSMQIVEGSRYLKQSRTISQRVRVIPAQRGEIFDRSAKLPMVINNDSFAVDITLGEIPVGRLDSVLARLAFFLGIQKTDIDEKVAAYGRNSYTAVEIKTNVPFSVISNIAENASDLPGVGWRSKPIRNYLETGSMSHIVGYVGDITKDELKALYNKGYGNTSIIGKTGIEKQYDELLQGKPGTELHTVDAKGRLMSEKPVIHAPVSGKNLILTVDTKIQTLAEKALGERVGAVVVLKPATGEILAMVSYPYFNPNIFNKDNASSAYNELAKDIHKPLINRTVGAVYPPASTFKTVMTTAILSEGTLSPDQKIECKGVLDYGNRTFHCHIGVPGHGYMNLKNALAQSCNIYFWTAGRDYLGVDRIAAYASEFGLGQSLQIDLPVSEKGFIPTAQWKERRYHEKWHGGDTMSMSLGQGYSLVTPLHIANMMAMFVNEGTIYEPHLLKEVRNPDGEVIETIAPKVLHKSTVAPNVWTTMKEYLRYMVTNGSAQSVLMRQKAVQIAGKTGTAEVTDYDKSWHSWFVGFGPYDAEPKDAVVVCVLVEAVNPWEWWAPYASTIIFQGIFANQTYDEAIDELHFRYLTKPTGRQE